MRDRPYCNWGEPGRVRNGLMYSWIRINPKRWKANDVLALVWALLSRSGRAMVYFSNTAVCDRLRTEARGEDGLQPAKKDFIFGVAEGASGELHMAPLTSEESVGVVRLRQASSVAEGAPKGKVIH